MSSNDVLLLESYFDFLYARIILSTADEVLKQMCEGCRKCYLSQRNHSCLSVPKPERIELYFQEILDKINEEEILRKWDEAVESLNDIPPGLTHLFKLKIGCKNWRETQLKTETWKVRMLKMVKKLISLERHF